MGEHIETKGSGLDPRQGKQPGKAVPVLGREVFFKGQTIIHQGDEAYRAYYIEAGNVEVLVKDSQSNIELKVAELGVGDLFGEMALIEKGPRTATVKALNDVTVTVISRDEIEGKIRSIKDEAIRALINVLIGRVHESTQHQVEHYRTLAQFQDRIAGIVDRVDIGINEDKRTGFRAEVTPLLNQLQKVLDRYQK